jgi:predicted ATPase
LLVGLPFESASHIEGIESDPSQVSGRAYVVSRQLLQALCATNPVVMYVEDLQWADSASCEYLSQVVMDERQNGMFILATARNSSSPVLSSLEGKAESTLPAKGGMREVIIPLAPLPDAAARELAGELLQYVVDVPEEVVRLVVERAEGVPYFVEELVNYFMDQGIIDRSRDG